MIQEHRIALARKIFNANQYYIIIIFGLKRCVQRIFYGQRGKLLVNCTYIFALCTLSWLREHLHDFTLSCRVTKLNNDDFLKSDT